jgi:hypothetical protein
MFRENPQYIVAGEIVRTSRMYAMSVSPLSRIALERISAELYEALGGKAAGEKGASDFPRGKLKARDFTNNIRIGGEVFAIETVKGKKTVRLPWEQLAGLKDKVSGETGRHKGLRGRIILEGRYTLLDGEKLELILSLVPSLDVENALGRKWPRKKRFSSAGGLNALLEELPLVLSPALWRPGKKELGFLCLRTDSNGYYWFACTKGFHAGLNESLASLEALIDELGDEVDIDLKHRVNLIYRRLSDYLGGP